MELKDPYARLFVFSVFLLLEIWILIYYLRKDIHYSSWGDFLTGPLFLNGILVLSFSLQAWKAYQETNKTEDETDR
jgi:hypothetical protein